MAVGETRCRGMLGAGTGGRRSTNGKNRALIRSGRDMVHGRDGGNSALIYLVGAEGERKGV